MAGLRNKWPCNGFLVETEQEGAADTLRETFDKLQYAWQNILAFHGSEERFFHFAIRCGKQNRIQKVVPTLESLFLEVAK